MTIEYTPKGVCSRKITAEVEDGIVKSVVFTGGCNEDVIARLENVDCGGRGTSCPDQLAKALKQAL